MRRVGMTLAWSSICVLVWCLPVAGAEQTVFVERGVPKLVRQEGKAWTGGDGCLECSGRDNYLWADVLVGDGDFHLTARLSLTGLGGTAASVHFAGSNFGLEGDNKELFVEGPLFGGPAETLGPTPIRDGQPFVFEAVRKGTRLTFAIDGKQVYESDCLPGVLGPVALRPWRSTMRVMDFSMVGKVIKDVEPAHQVNVFISGAEGYHTYRIPAIVLTNGGTLLAFCEGRKTGGGDHGDLDLVLRRSTDLGKTWGPMQLVHEEGGTAKITIGNPCPVVDRTTGAIWLPFCRNNDRVLLAKSTDDGKTWTEPIEITKDVKKPEWKWYATGPGHGIQLSSGRLMIPCDCGLAGVKDWAKAGHSLVFYSDDHGGSWKLGGVAGPGGDECEVVQLADGSLLLSIRNYLGPKLRAFAASTDDGLSWSKLEHHADVYCPRCQSSIQRYTLEPAAAKNRILYSGPGGPGRSNMTVRLSYDEGKSWPVAKVINYGPAAYSDLVVLTDGSIGCLYEGGTSHAYQNIVFARFTLHWLTNGADRLVKGERR